jgi:hypothetical protein
MKWIDDIYLPKRMGQYMFDSLRKGKSAMKWIDKWEVPSSSSNRTYVVSVSDNGEWGCSCPSWKFHRRICKHIQHTRVTQDLQLTSREVAGNREVLGIKTYSSGSLSFPKKEESENEFFSKNEFSL